MLALGRCMVVLHTGTDIEDGKPKNGDNPKKPHSFPAVLL